MTYGVHVSMYAPVYKLVFIELKESDLNAELREKNGVYYQGTDKQGNKIR